MTQDALEVLKKEAEAAGVELIIRGGAGNAIFRESLHVQIKGKLLVNYYPYSKGKTAYVGATVGGKKSVSPADAVKMALSQPPRAKVKDTRSSNSRKIRKNLMRGRAQVKCHWCPTLIDLDTSTLEHIIPLDRGGLDNDNNRTLACHPCNNKRGNEMLELTSDSTTSKSIERVSNG